VEWFGLVSISEIMVIGEDTHDVSGKIAGYFGGRVGKLSFGEIGNGNDEGMMRE
jgi:hypothetical protein